MELYVPCSLVIDDNQIKQSDMETVELTPEMKMAIEVGMAEIDNHDGWVEYMDSQQEVEDVQKGLKQLRKEFYGKG